MNGTEKQVAWAEQIKAKMLDGDIAGHGLIADRDTLVASRARRLEAGKDVSAATDAKIADLTAVIDAINAIDDAAWFIDKRSLFNGASTPYQYVREIETVIGRPSDLGTLLNR